MSSESVLEAIRKSNRYREENCPQKIRRSKFGIAAYALWPQKTAAELAFRTGVSERTVKNWLSGEHPPSARALVEIMREIG